MRQKLGCLCLLLFGLSNGLVFANNGIVMVTKIENNQKFRVPMTLEIKGAINMFSMLVEEKGMVETHEGVFRVIVTEGNKEYYLGFGLEVELITPGNFKQRAKKYFEDSPELIKLIGKRGFRYENLPSMILYFNKIKATGQALTKADMKYWTTIN